MILKMRAPKDIPSPSTRTTLLKELSPSGHRARKRVSGDLFPCSASHQEPVCGPCVLSGGFVPRLAGDTGRRQAGSGCGGTLGTQATFRREPGTPNSFEVVGMWSNSSGGRGCTHLRSWEIVREKVHDEHLVGLTRMAKGTGAIYCWEPVLAR